MNKRIAGFDGLRAIAVLMVFLQHRLFGDIGEIGHLGVWIFFALSGFLIIGILSAQRLRIEENGSGFVVELKRFLFRRTLRIFPIYYLMLTVMCVLMLFGIASPNWRAACCSHFAYLSNFWIGSVLHYWPGRYSHLWSLAIEEQFYLVVAPLLLLLAARRHFVACVVIAATGLSCALRDARRALAGDHDLHASVEQLLAIGARRNGRPDGRRRRRRCACVARPRRHAVCVERLSRGLLRERAGVERAARSAAVHRRQCRVWGCASRRSCVRLHAAATRSSWVCWKRAGSRGSDGSATASISYHNLIPDLTRNHRAQALFGGAVPLWAHTLGIAASFGISLGAGAAVMADD